ncbi:phosphomannomutase [Vibrio parahaemolyticus]|uniref:Phosphoglucosamine mutase n=2 Tax=Vibrio parahaemolyticus TaxID=670 RepID=A0A7M1WC51_VIBPH|nr:phosphomannomutase [Vibrio parahaemolyticus]ELC3155755.1 phosphomannomutase [Vibrio harveyi]OOI02263.1 phosphomannomutase [Vibrio sp. OULL4]EGR3111603.1 phosphomannomutase [Vibrio parahaemolyticus]EHH2554863.1 phosphomannomutase [Vibrio parahaemolyticus]EHK2858834.1 phosphomannomutase [Vibrio parahaemolyticus]
MLNSRDVIFNSGIQFGTSGARGLVEQFSIEVCEAFTHSFISVMKDRFVFNKVAIAIDNRPSSFKMAMACVSALNRSGLEVAYYGVVPTPALAYSALQEEIPCIMVTGSHIPFDRNGLKFYRPDGEISKEDEHEILSRHVNFDSNKQLPSLRVQRKASLQYIERYTGLFDNDMLSRVKVGIYEHSSAGRDIYARIFESLGATVVSLGRTDKFVPIDTEAVSESDREKAKKWIKEHELDLIFSTDGDGDRPLVSDENGCWLRGDILGLLCSWALKAEAVAIPISCNTAIEKSNLFQKVNRTKIGSPYVISEFPSLSQKYEVVVGFEANGGYLLGSNIKVNGRILKSLPTRDAILPVIMLLSLCKQYKISELVDKLPNRFTHSDRITDFASDKSLSIIEETKENPKALLNKIGLANTDILLLEETDGLRLVLENDDVIHLRPSGNAPELRCYAESSSMLNAINLVETTLDILKGL